MSFPYDAPTNTDEFRAMVEAVRKECWDNSGALRDMVPYLRVGIREALIAKGRGTADARLAARLITRPMIISARLQEDSARQVLRSLQKLNDAMTGRSSRGSAPRFTL